LEQLNRLQVIFVFVSIKANQCQLNTHEKNIKIKSGTSTQYTQSFIAYGAVSVSGHLKFAGQLARSKTEPIDPVFQGLGLGNPPAQFFHNAQLFPNCGHQSAFFGFYPYMKFSFAELRM
jgi:hypothetical protein